MRRDEDQTEGKTELTVAPGSQSDTEQTREHNREHNRERPATTAATEHELAAGFDPLDGKPWIIMDKAEFAPSPIHGIGVFATEDLEIGTRIIQEPALWKVDKAIAIKASFPSSLEAAEMRANIIESFHGSNPYEDGEEKQAFGGKILELCGGFTTDDDVPDDPVAAQRELSEKLREILILNGVVEKGQEQAEWVAVFEGSSRLNHSCAPNAERTTATVTGGIVVCVHPRYLPSHHPRDIDTNPTTVRRGHRDRAHQEG